MAKHMTLHPTMPNLPYLSFINTQWPQFEERKIQRRIFKKKGFGVFYKLLPVEIALTRI